MLKNIMKSVWLFASVLILFSACQKEEELATETTLNAFVNDAVFRLEESGNMGSNGCHELVFPVTIVFPDETTQEVSDYVTLRESISTWKESNPDVDGKPSFLFPLEVLSDEGELISVADQGELRALKRACNNGQFNGHKGNCGQKCFELVFPLSISFPDGTTETYEDKAALKLAIRSWKEANPDAEEKPALVFPIEVLLEDETTMTLENQEALEMLKESCSESN